MGGQNEGVEILYLALEWCDALSRIRHALHDPADLSAPVLIPREGRIARGQPHADVDTALTARMALRLVDGAMQEVRGNPKQNPEQTVAHVADAYARWLMKGDPQLRLTARIRGARGAPAT
ncbi:MAG: hypothetical protein AAGJ92_09015, partial [Pseudomonadota bacterium]